MDSKKIPYPPLVAQQSLEELVSSESILLSALISQVEKQSEIIKVLGDNLSKIRMELDTLKKNLGE